MKLTSLRTLMIVLAVFLMSSPGFGKSERHDYGERKQLRHALKLVAPPAQTLKPAKLWQGFQLDVF